MQTRDNSAVDPVVVMAAPNGARRTRRDHPRLPLTAAELAEDAAACLEAGASACHFHVRDGAGRHVLDPELFREVIRAIRARVGDRLVLQMTSESLGRHSPAEQRAVVRAVRPEAVSFALRELLPDAAEEIAFAKWLRWMAGEGILPQVILHEPRDALHLGALLARGFFPWERVPVLFVLGRFGGGRDALPEDLSAYLGEGMPEFPGWMACAFGPYEAACARSAIARGGHVRIGLENNLRAIDGTPALTNAAQIAAIAAAVVQSGRRPADADEVRSLWGAVSPGIPER